MTGPLLLFVCNDGHLLKTVSFLPFSYASVLVPPYRIAPVMPDISHFPDMIFIDVHPKARAIRNPDIAVFIEKHLLIHDIIKQIRAFVVMDS